MRRRDLIVSAAALTTSWAAVGTRALAQEADREAADPSRLTAEEHRHLPVLVMPERVRGGRPFDLVIQVGVDPHVMTEAHRIDRVELLVDERRVFAADLGPSVAYPVVRVPLVLARPVVLSARAICNLHGGWRTRRRIEVS